VPVARKPLHRWRPPHRDTLGDLACKVGADLGLVPDSEQAWLLDSIYAENEPGIPAAYEVCVVAPRQNLKSATLEMAALTDLFVIGVPLAVWTAHEFKTARKSFEDMRTRIMQHPDYAERTKFRDSHGEEAIYLDTGERLEFHARSGGSGRGFTCDRLTLDEAMYLQDGDLGALVPTMFTRPDAQVRYGSSAGKTTSAALRALRSRGRAGSDPSLAYVEYGAERRPCASDRCTHELGSDGCALDDRELWWQANCALWAGRADEEAVERQRRALPPREFAREFLSWWEDPAEEGDGVFEGRWPTLADPEAKRGQEVTFGVAVAPDRSWSAVAVAWRRPDDRVQVMLADYRPGTSWVGSRVVELQSRWGGRVLASTAAKGLVDGAESPSQGEQALAHTGLDDLVSADRVRHGNEPALNTAVRAARWKPYGDTRMFDRKGHTDISPLDAAALAAHAAGASPPEPRIRWL
jgi:hypothetical protein